MSVSSEPTPTKGDLSARGVAQVAARVGWGAFALFLAAFAVFESVKYGLPTTLAALTFLALPDLTMFIGLRADALPAKGYLPRKAVPFYNAMHRAWVPLAVLVAYSFGPVDWPPLFTAALGWLTHIAIDRAAGYGLRAPDGSRRRH